VCVCVFLPLLLMTSKFAADRSEIYGVLFTWGCGVDAMSKPLSTVVFFFYLLTYSIFFTLKLTNYH